MNTFFLVQCKKHLRCSCTWVLLLHYHTWTHKETHMIYSCYTRYIGTVKGTYNNCSPVCMCVCVCSYFGNLSLSIFIHWRVGLSCSVHLTISLYSARDSFISPFEGVVSVNISERKRERRLKIQQIVACSFLSREGEQRGWMNSCVKQLYLHC